jgi:hypothetical protein
MSMACMPSLDISTHLAISLRVSCVVRFILHSPTQKLFKWNNTIFVLLYGCTPALGVPEV